MKEAEFRFPTYEGAVEVTNALGIEVEKMTNCQDWEYTFPNESDLDLYFGIYKDTTSSPHAKRVLALFILECIEDRTRSDSSFNLDPYIKVLMGDIDILRTELEYWGNIEEHPVEDPDSEWTIAPAIRKYLAIAQQGAAANLRDGNDS